MRSHYHPLRVRITRRFDGQRMWLHAEGWHDALEIQRGYGGTIVGGPKGRGRARRMPKISKRRG